MDSSIRVEYLVVRNDAYVTFRSSHQKERKSDFAAMTTPMKCFDDAQSESIETVTRFDPDGLCGVMISTGEMPMHGSESAVEITSSTNWFIPSPDCPVATST